MLKEQKRQDAPAKTEPKPLDAAQLEQVVGGFSAGASGSKWGNGGGKSLGAGASGSWKY